MAKIKITKEQAIMLENLNKKKVIKITEAQYKRLIESLNPKDIDRAFRTAMHGDKDFMKNRNKLDEGLWESFINELYGLNESSEKMYETLINIMEACGYVENRKLSKTKFGGDKKMAKDVILGGLQTLHETGSPFMAMEAMEGEFKSEKKNPFFKEPVDRWFNQGNQNTQVKKYYDNGDYWLAWQLARTLGNVGKAPQNPQDMEIVQSKMTEEESDVETPTKMVPINPEVEDEVDTITMDVPLFIRALEYSREDAQSDMDLHDIAQNAIVLSKEYGTLNMDNYSDIFGDAEEVQPQPAGEEPKGLEEADWFDYLPDHPANQPEVKKPKPMVDINKIPFETLVVYDRDLAILKNKVTGDLFAFDWFEIPNTELESIANRLGELPYGYDEKTWYENYSKEDYANILAAYASRFNSNEMPVGLDAWENGMSLVKIDDSLKTELLRTAPSLANILNKVDEATSTTGALGMSSPINPIGYEPNKMQTESKIYEALNALKKK